MSGPAPVDRPEFPASFVEQARDLVRRRTCSFQLRQRAQLVLLLEDQPAMPNVAAGLQVDLHADSVRHWRRRWTEGSFSLQDEPGRGRKPAFFPAGPGPRQSDCL